MKIIDRCVNLINCVLKKDASSYFYIVERIKKQKEFSDETNLLIVLLVIPRKKTKIKNLSEMPPIFKVDFIPRRYVYINSAHP